MDCSVARSTVVLGGCYQQNYRRADAEQAEVVYPQAPWQHVACIAKKSCVASTPVVYDFPPRNCEKADADDEERETKAARNATSR
ncbi:hypothetical protein O181_076114 [Austropuccinia psidii MF-1]|uniref:Uncharacterized protein n=1 Tax=Austropuccinia psidii MF-1 TaxID=1389203 RepID=A0A9Q3FBV2_9BASI|nr:hypothetical protein [Austropuccinia psidii MF-1]